VIFRELVLEGASADHCLVSGGLDDFRIEETEFTACRTGARLVGSHRGILSSSWFHDTLGPAVALEGGADDVLIHGNWFESIPSRAIYAGGVADEAEFRPPGEVFEARAVRAVANVFVEIGMGTDGGVMAFVGCVDCVFAHNTFHLGRPYVIRILEENPEPRLLPARNGLVANNIIVFDSRDLVRVVNVDSDPTSVEDETFSFRSNLYHAVDDPMFPGPDFEGMIPPETGQIVNEDPRFTMPTSDYSLQAGSPAIHSGVLVPESALGDYEGRCFADPPSRGAFEVE
jgi:hypothetical protein